jgi:antigen 43
VSPDHAIFIDGKLICARQLVNETTISREMRLRSVDYFHVELDGHAILVAEGLLTESYLDTGNRGFFTNAGQAVALHPDLTDPSDCWKRETASCAPFVWGEESVRPVWDRLAARAAQMGRPMPVRDVTNDSELQVIAKGCTLRDVSVQDDRHVFVLPKDVTEVRLVSCAAAPSEVRPWLEDSRCLGIYVERIVLRTGTEVREVAVDHVSLTQGWWAAERNGLELRRWTNGDAVLPLPDTDDQAILEIHSTNGGMIYPVGAAENRRQA